MTTGKQKLLRKGFPPVPPMPGPNDPGPKFKPILPKPAIKAGAMKIPGFGQVERTKNKRRYQEQNAFNPGPKTGNWS